MVYVLLSHKFEIPSDQTLKREDIEMSPQMINSIEAFQSSDEQAIQNLLQQSTKQNAILSNKFDIEPNSLQLEERIGEGVFSIVYRAILKPFSKQVAVKLLHSRLTRDISQEVVILKQLEHPYV